MKYLMMVWLIVASFSSNAESNNSKFSCTYKSATGSLQNITFEGPQGVDLTYPQGLRTIPFTLNGSSSPMIFEVIIFPTRVGYRVFYTYKNPVGVSDISITYEEDTDWNSTYFGGTWTVDYPPVLNLKCHFYD